MSKIALLDSKGKSIGEKEHTLTFTKRPNSHAIKSAVVGFLAHQRQGTAKTKTRGEVSGSGKKPWKQKGTGRARSGERTSPVWRGGGTVFGPKPHEYTYLLNKRVASLARASALKIYFDENKVLVVKDLKVESVKTKLAKELLNNLKVQGKVLIVVKEIDPKMRLAFRNIPQVDLVRLSDLNTYSIMTHSKIIFSEDAFEGLSIYEVEE